MKKFIFGDKSTGSIKKKKLKGTVVLSFFVSLFAVFSLIVCGASQVSYAIDPDTTNTFTFYMSDYFLGDQDTGDIQLRLLYSDQTKTDPVFCIEYNVGLPENGTQYAKDVENTIENDTAGLGLLYILSNSYASTNQSVRSAFLSGADDEVKYFATQVAIWLYLDQTHPNDPKHKLDDAAKAAIENITNVVRDDTMDPYNKNGYNLYQKISELVAAAKVYNENDNLTVSQISTDLSIQDGNDYYESEYVTVGSTGNNLSGYTATVSGIQGSYIVECDSNGANCTESDGSMTTNQTFRIRVPKDKVTKVLQTLKVDVVGSFNLLTGYYFKNNDAVTQRVVSVGKKATTKNTSFNLEVIGPPDTGMTTAQTIYFIGLIVLLCGIGIVYANAKPSEIKQ